MTPEQFATMMAAIGALATENQTLRELVDELADKLEEAVAEIGDAISVLTFIRADIDAIKGRVL